MDFLTYTLERLGLEEYHNAFAEHDVDTREKYLTLEDVSLRELGVKPEHRQRLMDDIENLQAAGDCTCCATPVGSHAALATPLTTDFDAELEKLGLGECKDVLRENGIVDWETVKELAEKDLKELGIKVGYRRILQREIATRRPSSREEEIILGHRIRVPPPVVQVGTPERLVDIAVDNFRAMRHPMSTESRKYTSFLRRHPPPPLIESYLLLRILKVYVSRQDRPQENKALCSAFDRVKTLAIDWKIGRINTMDPYKVGHFLGELHATLWTIGENRDASRVEFAVQQYIGTYTL
ncbi:hypothetical protein BU16DRAFT_561308 [Lophium mytilinum]|uniref:SAM domain-containing protein n=1 Tax=Lophium mytilinum TaxID=390894 RepID=A0A6A6QXX0_9PEZI|nr:hypothetical protein BU16DRAFT_561308 [Lophium mytilinum]